jgi:hypothetical protein
MPLKLLMRPSGLLVPTAELGVEQLPERQLILGDDIPYGLVLNMAHDGLTPRLLQVDAQRNLKVTMGSSLTPGVVRLQDGTTGQLGQIGTTGDGVMPASGLWVNAFVGLYDGTGVTRAGRMASATNLALLSGQGAQLTAPPGQWSQNSTPGTGVQATTTRAAGGVGVRHICTGFGFGFSAAVAVAATTIVINLRDGASGAGAILKSWQFALPAAVVPNFAIEVTGCELVGSANTAMTLEFSALLANLLEFVNLAGHDAT